MNKAIQAISSENCSGIYFDDAKKTFTVDLIKTIHGKRVHIHGSNYPDLESAITSKEELIKSKVNAFSTENISFELFFAKYVSYRKKHVRDSSISQAMTVYHKYFFSRRPENASSLLSYESLEIIYESIVYDSNLSSSWKNRIIGIIRGLAAFAFRHKVISSSTYQDIASLLENIPENRKKNERPIWNKTEEERFLSCIDNPTHKIMFNLFIELGTRLGEFLGLTWDVYDGKRGTITICKQLLHASQKTYVLSEQLKTKDSYRVCQLKRETKEILNNYRKTCANQQYMFVSPINPNLPFSKAAFRKTLEHYIKKSGVKRITPHCVRHARATKLLRVCKNMIEVKAVAKYMGHSPTILLDIYSHSDDAIIDKILKRLE